MRSITRRRLLAGVVLGCAALACNLPFLAGGDEPAPPEVPVGEQPTPQDQPPVSGDSGGGPESLNLDDPTVYQEPADRVQSYRIVLSYSFEAVTADGSPIIGRVDANGARTLNPLAMSMAFEGEGSPELASQLPLKFSLIEGIYTIYSQTVGCATIPAGRLDNPFALLLDIGGFLTGSAPRVRPDEVVNGVEAYRFAIESSNVDETELDVGSIDSGAIYVAKEGAYILRLEMAGRGTNEALSGDLSLEGDVRYRLDYSDFDQPVTVAVPAECGEAAASDYPMVDDAFDIAGVAGLLSYDTHQEFSAVVQFYKDQMPQAGWTLAEEFIVGPLALLTFSGADGTIQVTVTSDASTQVISVVILEIEP